MQNPGNRRNRRSSEIYQALSYQLRSCREDAQLDAIVLADEDGICLASAGPADTCEGVAATLPILGRKAGDFDGVLLAPSGGLKALVQRFRIDSSELYLCAIGGDDDLRARQIARSITGVSRILAAEV